MANFTLSLQDLMSTDSSPFLREQNKNNPQGKPLITSGSYSNTGTFNPTAGMSTLSMGEMLMGQPLFRPQAAIASEQEQASSTLLSASVASSDTQNNQGLGAYNQFVPTDIKYAAAANIAGGGSSSASGAISSKTGSANTNSSGGPATTTSGTPATSDPVTGTQIANHPLFHTENTPGGAQLISDLKGGFISPNIMWILNLLITNGIDITASCGRGGLGVPNPASAAPGQGHSQPPNNPNDLHYKGEAIDLTYFGPPTGHERVIAPLGPITTRVIDIISGITGPHAPTEFFGPITYNKCQYLTGHETHLHVGVSTWDVPTPPGTAATTLPSSAPSAGAPHGTIN